MVRFYDPKDDADQARVEEVLRKGAIEYCVAAGKNYGTGREIEVAEEDLPRAEELLLRTTSR